MKRILLFLLITCLLMPTFASAQADLDAPSDTGALVTGEDFGDFVVGATTKLSGNFFTNMWGNNTCDIDVRQMLHGHSPVTWTTQATFEPDQTVVLDLNYTMADSGNKMYVIGLYDDLKYSDGTPIKASDYVFSLMLHAAPQITEIGGLTTNVGYVEGSDEYVAGESDIFSGLRIFSDYIFGIEIKSDYLPFFFELGMLDVVPYPISVIAPGCEVVDDGQGAYIRNIDTEVTEPIFTAELLKDTILDPDTGYLSHPSVVSGPYTLEDFDWDTRVARFQINPYFKGNRDGRKPTIDNVVFKSVLPETMMDELEKGEVHVLNKVVAADNINKGLELTRIVDNPPAQATNYFRIGMGFLTFSCEQGPAQFQAVRQAVAYSVDSVEFRNRYLQGYGMETYGYYGVGQWMVMMMRGFTDQFEFTPEEQEQWTQLTLNELNTYDVDPQKAKQLLIDDGWTLDENGDAFEEGVDAIRHKMVDGELMPLVLTWSKMQDSIAADILDELMVEPLKTLGMSVETSDYPFVDILNQYYRQPERVYDMAYLATNFISIFDPYYVFNTQDEYQGKINTTGLRDEELEALALDLRSTEPGDLLGYCRKWLAFQKSFNEKLPMIPLYSNIYFDFFTPELNDYNPNAEMSWPVALLYAYLGEPIIAEDDAQISTDDEAPSSTEDDDSIFLN